jgi:cell division protein FtsI (penicillin-binding protein 3)
VPLKRSRFWIVCLFFFLWACAIAGRLFWLQIVDHPQYLERAARQQQRTFEVAPRRGVLYDRNLRELAMTELADSIYADPTEIADKRAAAHTLAAVVHTDPADQQTTEDQIAARLNAGRNFAWIARRVSPQAAAAVKALNMKGIYFQKEFERFYPDNEIAAQVLGYVGVDDNGLGGLEEKFDSDLHGRPGLMYMAMDARRKVLGSSERDPEPGRNLVLTIDENIQFMAERALDRAMERTQALNGTVVVEDVHTGQILALAIRPTFNPNQFRHTTPELLRDHAVSDVYEPGSTFKLVTYSAAMDQKVATPDDTIDCQGGKITIFGRTIHDNQGEHFGVIPVHKALEESSDVAAVKLAMKIGSGKFYQYIRDFGFGARSGVELPGETRGLLRPVSRWQASSIGSVAIGQEIAVTPVQLVAMVSTIANGGVYLPPHVLMPEQSGSATLNQKAAPPQVAAGAAAAVDRGTGEARRRFAGPASLGRAPRHLYAGLGRDAQDDGGRGAVRHRQTGAAQRLLVWWKDGHRAKDRSRHAHLFEDHAHRLVRGLCAGQQSGHRRGRNPGFAEGRLLRRRCGCAGLRRCGAAGSRIPRRAARHRSAPHDERREKTAARGRRRCRGAGREHPGALRCRERPAQRRSAAPRGECASRTRGECASRTNRASRACSGKQRRGQPEFRLASRQRRYADSAAAGARNTTGSASGWRQSGHQRRR